VRDPGDDRADERGDDERPAKTAAAIERAGFTEVLLTGMLTRWISVNMRPIASGARAAYSFSAVTERMTPTNTAVSTTSISSTAPRPKPPGECSPQPFEAKPDSRAAANAPAGPSATTPATTAAPATPPTTCATT
jgi:hypothetical protein